MALRTLSSASCGTSGLPDDGLMLPAAAARLSYLWMSTLRYSAWPGTGPDADGSAVGVPSSTDQTPLPYLKPPTGAPGA
jgi:hypothetical protein